MNLYIVVALSSGERKSAVVRLATAPIQKLEAKLRAEATPVIREAEARKTAALATVKGAQRIADKADPADRDELLNAAVAAKATADAIIVPPWPRLGGRHHPGGPDVVACRTGREGGRPLGRGRTLRDLGGPLTDGQPNIDILLKGHSGDAVLVDRKGRPPERVDDAAITLGITVQPDVVKGLARNRGFRGRGLLARILFSLPQSRVGSRTIEPNGIPERVVHEYEKNILALAEGNLGGPTDLWNSPSILKPTKFVQFQTQLEPMPRGTPGAHS